MKRAISLVLAATLLFCSFAFLAQASVGTPLYLVTLPDGGDMFIVEPYEGFELLVPEGDEFAFVVKPLEGYSLKSATIAVNGKVIFETDDIDEYFKRDPNEQIYVIKSVTQPITITVDNVMEVQQANFFAWLIDFINQIFEFFSNLFGGGTVTG